MLFPVFVMAQGPALPEVTSVCNESFTELDAGAGYNTYSWSTGETTQTISVNSSGTYSVTVSLGGQFYTDETYVEFINYQLTPATDTTVCYGEPFYMEVTPDNWNVIWNPGNITASSTIITPTTSQNYSVTIRGSQGVCSEAFQVDVYEAIIADIEPINDICFGNCNGQAIAHISGGLKPYEYIWNGNYVPWDSISTELCPGNNHLEVYDARGCKLDTTFFIDALPAADVEILTSPGDTLYLENPTLTFSFENHSDTEVTEWIWDFGENTEGDTSLMRSPTHTFEHVKDDNVNSYTVLLTATNELGCDTIVAKELPVEEAKLKIPDVLTPNSDGFNDQFVIQNDKSGVDITYEFKRVEVYVYNRYGRVVYKNSNYQSDWEADGLSDGTYFYVIRTHGQFRDDEYQGAITIIGSGL